MKDPVTGEYDFTKLNRELDKTKAKVFLGNNAAFFAPLMCSLHFRWDTTIETAATDGTAIMWNPDDFIGCTSEGRVSSLMHELGHVYRMHPSRRGHRCPDVWNIAGDIAINRELIDNKYDLTGWAQAGIGPHPEIPHEIEEDIYDYLNKPGGGGNQQPGQMPGNLPGIGGKCCSGFPAVITPAMIQTNVNNVVQAMQAATMAGDPGSIPGAAKEIITQFLAPVVPWETALMQFFTDLIDEDHSWHRPNRRHQDIYLPTRYEDSSRLKSLNFYQDTSGSISTKDAIRFNSELKYIWEILKPEKMTIVQFDTKIQKIDILEDGDNWIDVEIQGRGGTSFTEVRKHILDTKPDAAIIFSDMYVNPMRPGPTCPIIWIAVDNKDATVPFGKLIHINA